MWSGTVDYRAERPGTVAGDALDPADYAAEPAITVTYDAVRQAQRLTYRGVLVTAERDRLTTTYPSPLLAGLLGAVHTQAGDFFDQNLLRHVVGTDPVGFLQAADFDTLFTPFPG